MGYRTEFIGQFNLDKPLAAEHKAYLERFAYTRRMTRDPIIAETLHDPLRKAVGKNIGINGEFFVGTDEEVFGQIEDESIVNSGKPPCNQPSLWCDWAPNSDGTAIIWDKGEKFYHYIEWIEYILQHFIRPWGYYLNGEVVWQGEEERDMGSIVITDNEVSILRGAINTFRCWKCKAMINQETAEKNKGQCGKCAGDIPAEPNGRTVRP